MSNEKAAKELYKLTQTEPRQIFWLWAVTIGHGVILFIGLAMMRGCALKQDLIYVPR